MAPGLRAEADESRQRALGFVSRIHRARLTGITLALPPIAWVFMQRGVPAWGWVLLLCYCIAWPHIGNAFARRSADPARSQYNLILVDSALGGVWIALMQFNLLPSVVVALLLAVDTVVVSGWRLFWPGLALQVLACMATAAATGFAFAPQSTQLDILVTLPFLVLYTLAASFVTHRLWLQSRRQNRHLTALNRIDPATGVFNRASIQSEIAFEWRRLDEGRGGSTLMMLDIDTFKHINDTWGHPAGDRAIQVVAAKILEATRACDRIGRYGGDEFAVLLVDADLPEAARIAERLRVLVSGLRFAEHPQMRCSVSIGLAASREAHDPHDWVTRADTALYRAKTQGRNRVTQALGGAPVASRRAPLR